MLDSPVKQSILDVWQGSEYTSGSLAISKPLIFMLKTLFPKTSTRGALWKSVLRNFTKFTGKHLCQSISLSKVVGLRSATLLKKRLWHRFFPVNFAKFLRIPLLQNTSGRLLLYFGKTFFVSRYLYLAPGGKFQRLYVKHIHQTIIN